jgi:hypothetical protein
LRSEIIALSCGNRFLALHPRAEVTRRAVRHYQIGALLRRLMARAFALTLAFEDS